MKRRELEADREAWLEMRKVRARGTEKRERQQGIHPTVRLEDVCRAPTACQGLRRALEVAPARLGHSSDWGLGG